MKTRAENIGPGEVVQLKVIFRDNSTNPVNVDSFPTIQLLDQTLTTYLPPTSSGVYNISTGVYAYDFTVPVNGPLGIWHDSWIGSLNGDILEATFNFIVSNVESGFIDGYEHLGDVPQFTLSQEAIHNINILMNILRTRLQSSGWHMIKDNYGNLVRENCDIFSVNEMYAFLCSSLSEFNSTPTFTSITWESEIVVEFRDVIVEGAYIMAVASKALIEKGREFQISDNGLSFTPPLIADLLNTQFSTMLAAYRDKLKQIKYQVKFVMGLGTLRITAVAPQILRLRFLRARQIL